jgi:hypothetical protein
VTMVTLHVSMVTLTIGHRSEHTVQTGPGSPSLEGETSDLSVSGDDFVLLDSLDVLAKYIYKINQTRLFRIATDNYKY